MSISDQGITQDRYMVIPRTLIFLTRGEMVLLIRGSPEKRLWAGLYNGIGGHIEPGEDVISSAERELLEESGLVAEDLWLCATITIDTGQIPGIILFVFRGENNLGDLRQSKEGQLEWIHLSKAYLLPVVEDLPILLPRIMAMRKGDPILAGYYSYDTSGKLLIKFN